MIKSNFTQNYAIGFTMAAIVFFIVLLDILLGTVSTSIFLFIFVMFLIFFATIFFKNLPYYSNLVLQDNKIIINHFIYDSQTIYLKNIIDITFCGRQWRTGYELTVSFLQKNGYKDEFIFYSPLDIENFIVTMKEMGVTIITK